jgi:hypothetical protein
LLLSAVWGQEFVVEHGIPEQGLFKVFVRRALLRNDDVSSTFHHPCEQDRLGKECGRFVLRMQYSSVDDVC